MKHYMIVNHMEVLDGLKHDQGVEVIVQEQLPGMIYELDRLRGMAREIMKANIRAMPMAAMNQAPYYRRFERRQRP